MDIQNLPQPIAIFGEVLFDQFPDGQRLLGGAPFNVAWHLQAFGHAPCFISRVGNDALGADIRAAMSAWGMDTDNLQTDPEHPTGVVQITLTHGEPAYQILDHQAYDYIAEPRPNTRPPAIIYHGSLALRHPTSAQALQALTVRHTSTVFVDVNLRAPWWQAAQVKTWLAAADWVKLNEEELQLLARPQATLTDTLQAFLADYQLATVVVTRGGQGAVALTAGGELIEVAPDAGIQVADTVGAGDAFASVLLLGLQRGWPLALTMGRAQDFASALVGRTGATVQDRAFYQPFRLAWGLAELA
ncbi:MAG: carbohydrate kinase [Methylovulum sp.]|nr:carbohydrate kinase [Methylovulum sp.]